MPDIDLAQKFPELQPIDKAPSLYTVNGFGLAMYGRRDFDDETGTYVKTHCLSALFIPLLALRAYRVASAGPGQGWYFIGREPLSTLARAWNAILVCGVLAGVGIGFWISHTNSADYRAGRALAEAENLASAGKVVDAARKYRDASQMGSSRSAEAVAGFTTLLKNKADGLPPSEARELVRLAADMQNSGSLSRETVHERATSLAERHADADPAVALELLDIAGVPEGGPEAAQAGPLRRRLLETLVVRRPDDVQIASRLAAVFEAEQNFERCEELLAPHAERLGSAEGARILGQIYAGRGEFDQAYPLLSTYCAQRLNDLHAAEKSFETTITAAQERLVSGLRAGSGPDQLYRQLENADEDRQSELLQEYLGQQLAADPSVQAARDKLAERGAVVPVALELGIVLLRRGQSMDDPAARQAELEKAEKTFLAIRGQAGDSDQYRLFLGQVYYWLGKHEAGRTLFDELLASKERDSQTLAAVSHLLREIGESEAARPLAEEAYEKAATDEERHTAAGLRALLATGLDDTIAWLEKDNQRSLRVQAELATNRGRKALEVRDDEQAASHFRKAIELYSSEPDSSAKLNNTALVYFALYSATGDRADFRQGAEMLERAVALAPSDAIVLFNAAHVLLEAALQDVIGAAIDLKRLKISASLDLLAHLYDDETSREAFVARVCGHEGVRKARDYLDRVLVLSPKRVAAYALAARIDDFCGDTARLQRVQQQIESAGVDAVESIRQAKEFYDGTRDEELRAISAAALQQHRQAMDQSREDLGINFAVSAAEWIEQQSIAAMLGEAGDADEFVRVAEDALAAAPSKQTRDALMVAVSERAERRLSAAHEDYASLVDRTRRTLAPVIRIAAVVWQGGPLAAATLSDPDVERLIELIIDDCERFPKHRGTWDWVMLRDRHPELAAAAIENLKQHDELRIKTEIDLALSPASVVAALSVYWTRMALDEEEDAADVLKRCAAHGVAMPFEP